MIRSAKALLTVLCFGSLCFAQAPAGTANASDAKKKDAEQADAYYHFAMGRLYADLAGSSYGNQNENISKAIQNYQEALKADPSANLIFEELTDLYIQTGRLKDAIAQAEDLLQKDPDNLQARRMLGRIYWRAANAQEGRGINEAMLRSAIEQFRKIVEKDPKDIDSWVVLGRLYGISNNSTEAEKAYNAALKADPQNEDALTGLALLYSDLGDTDRAIEKLKAATDKRPNEHTLAALADAYERNRDFKNAADALRRASELSPDNTRLQEALARDLLFSDQFDEALKIYRELANDDPKESSYRLRLAQIYRSKHDIANARLELNKAKQLEPDNVDVAYEEVSLLDAEGKTDQAVAQLKALLEQTKRNSYSASQASYRAQLLEQLGRLYRGTGQYQPAIDAYKQIAALDNAGAPRVAALIVDTYRQAKDFANARMEAEAAVKKFPDERMVHIAYAEVLSDQGKIDEAVAEVNALPKGERDLQTQMELAQIYEKGKRWADMGKALDAAEKAATAPDDKESVQFMRGAMYERMKKFDEAEAAFRQVLKLNPDNAGALNYLGYMLADRNVRLDEAYQLIKKALDLDPQNGAYLDSMGWLYFKQGKLDAAEEMLVRAIDRMGQDPTVHEHLGDVYAKLGKTKEAIAQWQASVKGYQSASPSESDADALAKVTKKLESARVRLAKENK